MFRDIDWLGLLMFTYYSASIGVVSINLSKSSGVVASAAHFWGGWLAFPSYPLQGLGAFLMWRTNGTGDAPVYEIGLSLFFFASVVELLVVFLLHTQRKRKLTMVTSLLAFFGGIACACMFFTEHRSACLWYSIGMVRTTVITYRSIEVAVSTSTQKADKTSTQEASTSLNVTIDTSTPTVAQ